MWTDLNAAAKVVPVKRGVGSAIDPRRAGRLNPFDIERAFVVNPVATGAASRRPVAWSDNPIALMKNL